MSASSKKKSEAAKHKAMTALCKEEKCLVCGTSPCEPCHIKHRGMGGANSGWEVEDIWPGCRRCHDQYDKRNGASKAATEKTRIAHYIVHAKAPDWQRATKAHLRYSKAP